MINLLPFMELHHLNTMKRNRRCPSKYSETFYAGLPKNGATSWNMHVRSTDTMWLWWIFVQFCRHIFSSSLSVALFFFGMMPFEEYGLIQCDRIASNHLLCIMLKKLHKHIRRSHRFYYKHRVQVCCCCFFFANTMLNAIYNQCSDRSWNISCTICHQK